MSHDLEKTTLSSFPKSYWLADSVPRFAPLTEDTETEVAVIGGGIVGVMAAYLLARAGKSVILVEAKDLLSGTTGHTTAKITAQHGLIYDALIRTFDEETARLYYDANMEGGWLIQEIAGNLDIDCQLESKDAVVFANGPNAVKKLQKEAKAYEQLSIDGVLSYGSENKLPFPVEAKLTMQNQAQFHPVQFLTPLLDEIEKNGGRIYDQTRALKVSKDGRTVETEHGSKLRCEHLVVATHYPFNDFDGFYLAKLSISRSYALAAKAARPLPEEMYISADTPTRSLRSIRDKDGEEWLLIAGDGHGAAKSETPMQNHYNNLEAFGRAWYGLEETDFHWSAQDMMTLDRVPYVGRMTSSLDNVFVATGFNKWGMAAGAVSAQLISDLILGRENAFADLFDPTRSKFKPRDIRQFVKKNVTVARDLVQTKVESPEKTIEELGRDEGGLVTVDGKKTGAYRDSDGQLHLVKPTCTHLGCGVRWNNAERSWDCPCHGSRFSYDGSVLNGPAVRPLDERQSSE